MSDTLPKITANLIGSQAKRTEPSARYKIDPCGPEVTDIFSSELTVLFPKTKDSDKKTVPLMGGSIVKITLGSDLDIEDKRFLSYVGGINSQIEDVFISKEIKNLESKSTSSLRTLINKVLVESISTNQNNGFVPNIYLSSTTSSFDAIDENQDNFYSIRKNAVFGFFPINSIKSLLEKIAVSDEDTSVIGGWHGLSGKTYKELYDISKQTSPNDEDISLLIMDIIPFLNISSKEMLDSPKKPVLGGYYTIIGRSIYLKMPDISGFDSAGFGDDYIDSSELNLLIQLINSDAVNGENSIKNIELKKSIPIYGTIEEPVSEDYDLKKPESFKVTFRSNKKPEAIYLSPAITDDVEIKNDIFRLISSSQSGKFIEYNPYPNPFVSITDEKIKIEKDSKNIGASNPIGVDEPFIGVNFYSKVPLFENRLISPMGLAKIRSLINEKYNQNQDKKGNIGPYLEQVFPEFTKKLPINAYVTSSNIENYYKSGFPLVQELFQKTQNVLGQSLSLYEFVGNLSRENLILHHGISFDAEDQESSGKFLNNLKYFKKSFIANSIGLCQNYRPRVFSSPKEFVPSTWIKTTNITEANEIYTAEFPAADILKFYNNSATNLKFVVYAYDGEAQISKFENGYINITKPPPIISSVVPDGFKQGGIILKCDGTQVGESKLTINTDTAEDVESVKIGSLEIKKESFSNKGPGYIEIVIPCSVDITAGRTKISIVVGGIESRKKTIYIANADPIESTVINPSDLPEKDGEDDTLTPDEVDPKNLKISGQNYEIPISYIDPRSKIIIKNSKASFDDGRSIYLYVATDSEDSAKQISQSVVKISNGGRDIYVAKDFNYKLSDSPLSDFYRSSKRKAYLYFPGNENINRPVGLLTTGISKAYFVLSTKGPNNFSKDDNLGILEIGKSQVSKGPGSGPARKPFVGPPLVIGMAARFYDNTVSNHFYNFGSSDQDVYYKDIAKKILEEELSPDNASSGDLISAKDKFKKLIVLFKYRDIKKYKKKRLSLYIKNKKVTKTISLEGAKRVSDIFSFEGVGETFYSKELYYFVISNLTISGDDFAEVRADIIDADFSISNSTKDKYIDYSARISKDSAVYRNAENKSIYLGFDVSSIYYYNTINTLFGNYKNNLALTGFFIQSGEDDLLNFGNFPPVSIRSNISCLLHDQDFISFSNAKVSLLQNSDSELLSIIPNSYFTIQSGAEIKSGEYLEGKDDYLIYHRFIVNDICKIAALKPEIMEIVEPKDVLIPGSRMTLIVKNILNYFVLEIAGTKAKVVDVEPFGSVELNQYKVVVIVPQTGIEIIPVDDCGLKLYNGNQILEGGTNQLGKATVQRLEQIIGGTLGYVTHQFERWKQWLKDNPITLPGFILDAAHLAKEFTTSFCNYSFKITADLKFHLDGFSQLLIPIKVIFCIIDVICNLFNPFQLPLAIIRLFECLYDLILLLPQISIPVMLFNLLIHLLEFLECLIVKVINLITAINLIIEAFNMAFVSDTVNFRELMVLEELLLKYVISVELDLELMEPIVQILAIFMQLLGVTLRFPCTINPNSLTAPCGIDGFELGSMISGLIGEQTGSAPHIKYKFDKKYLIPIAQPFTDKRSQDNPVGQDGYPSWTDKTSYAQSIEPARGSLAISGPTSSEDSLYDSLYFNPNSLRVKSSTFNPDTDDIKLLSTDTCVGLKASYTKRRKSLGSIQSVIFKFDQRTWKSFFSALDRQIIDENQAFDVPVTLLSRDNNDLKYAGPSSYGNLYSTIDMKAMMTTPSDNRASIRPLTLDIVQNGVTVERTFDTIPSMVILDDDFNVYIIEEDGIIFDEYKTYHSEETVLGISEIRATLISQQSATTDAFSKEDEKYEYTDDDGATQTDAKEIFSMPQLYFVDSRVAAEAIQAKCETASINQLPLDMSGDGGMAEVEKMSKCIQDFLSSIKSQTTGIKNSLNLGVMPEKMSQDTVDAAYIKLVNCTNDSISNLCSIVVNSLNTSFRLLGDTDFTDILPDPVASSEAVTGGIITGPAFTGAREYAGGVGDAVSVQVGSNANVYLLPRDVYDNKIYYDISSKSRIDIISDTTGGARITLHPTESNPQNYWEYNQADGSYSAQITSTAPGIVKIRAVICGSPVQALTYTDLVESETSTSSAGCVDDAGVTTTVPGSTPLGSLSRIDRILTITFTQKESELITIAKFDSSDSIITEPQLFATDMEN